MIYYKRLRRLNRKCRSLFLETVPSRRGEFWNAIIRLLIDLSTPNLNSLFSRSPFITKITIIKIRCHFPIFFFNLRPRTLSKNNNSFPQWISHLPIFHDIYIYAILGTTDLWSKVQRNPRIKGSIQGNKRNRANWNFSMRICFVNPSRSRVQLHPDEHSTLFDSCTPKKPPPFPSFDLVPG